MRYFVIFLLLSVFFYCCSDPTSKNNYIQEKLTSESGYIKIPDCDTFRKDWSKENTVVFQWSTEPDNLHPTNANSVYKGIIDMYTQMSLVSVDLEHLSLRSDLVKAMPNVSADGLEYTYELREEPRFDNGDAVTTDDVIFSFKAAKCPLTNDPALKSGLETLKNIVADKFNPLKFTLVMKKKYYENYASPGLVPIIQRKVFDPNNILSKYTLHSFNDPLFDVDSHKDLNEWATQFNNSENGRIPAKICGLGPYQVTSWDAGQTLILTKKINHWTSKLAKPNLYETSFADKIIFNSS